MYNPNFMFDDINIFDIEISTSSFRYRGLGKGYRLIDMKI